METAAQEREQQQGHQPWWPLLADTMACSFDISTSSSCSSLFGWDPQIFCFNHGAYGNGVIDSAGAHNRHDLLVPKCMESPVSEVSTAATDLPTVQHDAAAMRRELDELLQNLWDSEEGEGLSSCDAVKQESGVGFQHDHRRRHFDLGTMSPTVPTSPEKTLMMTPPEAEAELPSLSSSQGSRDPRASSGAHRQIFRASKRSAPEEEEEKGSSGKVRERSCKRSCRTAKFSAGGSVLRPFDDVVKPGGGADGAEATLADVNEWILTPPARPVRHPVGEFACSPRVSAGNRPAPSGKSVAGFTRLRTAGRGTITVVRTRG